MSENRTVDSFRNSLRIITKDLSDAIEKRPGIFVDGGITLTYQLMDMQIKVSQLEQITRIADSMDKVACPNCCKTAGDKIKEEDNEEK